MKRIEIILQEYSVVRVHRFTKLSKGTLYYEETTDIINCFRKLFVCPDK